MIHRTNELGCAALAIVALGCAGETRSFPAISEEDAGSFQPAAPGECQGTARPCELPPAMDYDEQLEAAPGLVCQFSRDRGRIVWTVPFGDVECPASRCSVGAVSMQEARDGGLWVSGDLRLGDSAAILGTALLRFDAEGNRMFAVTVDMRSRVAGSAPSGTRHMQEDDRGHLLWLAPMATEPGVELRDYEPSGRLVRAWPLVRTTTDVSGAILGPGSVLLAYGYDRRSAGLADSGPVAERGAERDIARFDRPHGVTWSFPVSSVLDSELFLAGAVPASDGLLIVGGTPRSVKPPRFVIGRVDGSGRVESFFESRTHAYGGATDVAGGRALVELDRGAEGRPFSVLIDATGKPVLRDLYRTLPGYTDWRSSSDGRLWASDNQGEGYNLEFAVISADVRRCKTYEADVTLCHPIEGGRACSGARFEAGAGGRIYLARDGVLTLIQVEELP